MSSSPFLARKAHLDVSFSASVLQYVRPESEHSYFIRLHPQHIHSIHTAPKSASGLLAC